MHSVSLSSTCCRASENAHADWVFSFYWCSVLTRLQDNVLNYVHVRLASWDRQSAQMFHHKICRTCVTIASHCIQKSGPMDINPAVAKDHALSQEPQHQPATIQPDGSFMGAADISSAPAPTSAEVEFQQLAIFFCVCFQTTPLSIHLMPLAWILISPSFNSFVADTVLHAVDAGPCFSWRLFR